MSFTKISALAGALSFASTVVAHGRVTGLVADGVYYQGFIQDFQYMQDPPAVAGWPVTYTDTGFVGPSEYTSSDIICHIGATPGKAYAKVAAGGSIDLQWTVWPESHHGPVIDYLASCDGDCTTVNKEALKFFKIDGKGLNSWTTSPGQWADDDLIANNNTWNLKIPSDIAPGNYVLRHEIIALHSAYDNGGAQNYPQCFNLEITGSGSAKPAGIAATEFYTPTDPGILVNIYNTLNSYEVPGPELYSGSGSSAPSSTSDVVSSPVSSTPAATSQPATSEYAEASTSMEAPAATSAPAAPTNIIPPYANSTLPSSTKKNSCESKSRKPTSTAAALPTVTDLPAYTATVIPVPESSSAASTTPASQPTGAPSTPATPEQPEYPAEAASLPEGTKLSAVLKWISSFYAKNGDGEYVPNAVTKRHHARHLTF